MALERMGLGAVLTVDSKPMVKGMNQARDATGRFIKTAERVPGPLNRIIQVMGRVATRVRTMAAGMRAGMQQMGMGLRNLGMGLAPMALGLGAAVKSAADFEKQMSGVAAITNATAEEQRQLEKKAKQTGIVSAFSATESGLAMEFMSRAGANTAEVIAGLDGVVNLAAADSMELADAADIVSRVVRGMGMEFSEATHIADVLALASSKTNTNVKQLGESFVYGAATARQAGISLEETTALLGKMADSGLRGSLAGTGLTNMLGKLTKPTSKSRTMMKEWRIELDNTDGSMKKVSNIVAQFKKHIEGLPTKTAQLAAAQEIFGKRGARAYGALAAAGEDATNELEKLLIMSSQGEGAAARMAAKRLDNLLGKLTLFKSSLEGLALGVFGPIMKKVAKSIGKVTDGLNAVLFVLDELNDPLSTFDDKMKAIEKGSKMVGKKNMPIILQIAYGIRDAVTSIGDAWDWIAVKVKTVAGWLGDTFGGEGISSLAKWVTILGTIAGVLTPALLGLMMFKWVAGGLISVLAGVGKMMVAAFWPALIAAGLLAAAYFILRRENESFGDTAARVWGNIKTWALDLWHNVLKPMWEGIKEGFMGTWDGIKFAWAELKVALKEGFRELHEAIFGVSADTEISWKEVGKVVGTIIGRMIEGFITFHRYVVPVFVSITKNIVQNVKVIWGVFSAFGTFIGELFGKFTAAFSEIFSGNIITGLKRLGLAILDFVMGPVKPVLTTIVKVAKLLKLEDKLPSWVKTLSKQSATGAFFPDASSLPSTKRYAGTSIGKKKKQPFVLEEQTIRARKGKGKKKKGKKKEEKGFMEEVVGEIADAVGAKAGARGGAPKSQTNITLEDKRTLDIRNEMCIDGEGMAVATARHTQEIQERSSFKATPWQRRMLVEHGAAPVKSAS